MAAERSVARNLARPIALFWLAVAWNTGAMAGVPDAAAEGSLGTAAPESLAWAAALGDSAVNLAVSGHSKQSRPLFAQAYDLYQRLGCRQDSVYNAFLCNYSFFTALDNRILSESLIREAAYNSEKHRGAASPDTRLYKRRLAVLLADAGRLDEAMNLDRELLSIQLKEPHGDPVLISRLTRFLGMHFDRLGEEDSTEAYYRRAMELSSRALEPDDPRMHEPSLSLGVFLREQGRLDEAEPLLRRALEGREKIFGRNSQPYAFALAHWAELRFCRGHQQEAAHLYDEALQLQWEVDQDSLNYYYLVVKVWCGRAHRKAGHLGTSERLLLEAARGYEKHLRRSGRGFRQLATALLSPYPDLCLLRLQEGRFNEAWMAVERGLGRVVNEFLDEGVWERADPKERALHLAASDMKSLTEMLRGRVGPRSEEETSRLLSLARDSLAALEIELSRLDALRDPQFRSEQTPSLARLQRVLGNDEALVGWVDVPDGRGGESWAYAVRRTGSAHWARVEDRSSECFALDRHRARPEGEGAQAGRAGSSTGPGVRRRHQELVDALSRPPGPLSVRPNCLLREIHRERIAPLGRALEGVTKLVVVSSGPMAGLPVEALMDSSEVPVGERYEVLYASSGSSLIRLRERAERGSGKRGAVQRALLVGDPTLGGGSTSVSGYGDKSMGEREPAFERRILRGVLRGQPESIHQLPGLPSSREEIDGIARAYPQSTVLLGDGASETALMEQALRGDLAAYSVIHLSTHAVIDNEDPLRSALVLSQTGLPDPAWAVTTRQPVRDGLLRVGEIMSSWRLDADLVTLSACETALGPRTGDESPAGFAHALLAAGARNLLLSLWKVDDEATALLMKRFHENRCGASGGAPRSDAAALREAREWLRGYRDSRGNRLYRDPYYWAAFVLMGTGSAR